jgi:hypothetical protein
LGKANAGPNADQIKSEVILFNVNHQGFSSRIRIFNTLKNSISTGGNKAFKELN